MLMHCPFLIWRTYKKTEDMNMRLIELIQSFKGMILLLIGKSGVGKSTLIKYLILKEFRRSFKVLDGIKSTTTVLMHYLFSKNLDRVKIGIKFKSKEKLKILFAENLISGLEKLMVQYVSGLPKNMSPYQEGEWIRKQLSEIVTKDYSKFFNIDKLVSGDKDNFVKMIHEKIYIEMEYLYQAKHSVDKAKDKQDDFRLQISSVFSTSSTIQSNFNDIFEWVYSKAANNVMNSGFRRLSSIDEDDYFEGEFLDELTLQNALFTINNSNRNNKSQDEVSSICMVEEIFLELPMCNFIFPDWPDQFVITDSYGLTHDGSKRINENLEAILIGQNYNGIVLLKEYSDDDGVDEIIKQLLESAHSCHVIPLVTKIEKIFSAYNNDDEDDEDELTDELSIQLLDQYITEEEASFHRLTKELVKNTIGIKVGSTISCNLKRKNIYFPEKYLMDNSAVAVIQQAYSAYKIAQVSIKLQAKTSSSKSNEFFEQYLIFEDSLTRYSPQILAALKAGIVKQYQEFVANSDDYHGNTVNTLVAHWMNGYGHNSNAQVYCNIYSNPFRAIQIAILQVMKDAKIIMNNQFVDCIDETNRMKLINSCRSNFELHLYNGLVKTLAYDNLSGKPGTNSVNLRNLWWYGKHYKLSVMLKLIEDLCCETELSTLNRIIDNALKNASKATINNAILSWE